MAGEGVEIQSRLSEKRKEKLLNLKKREELKDVLVSKLKGKYRNKDDDGAGSVGGSSSMIGKEVDKFLDTAGITETNLNRLERRIQKKSLRPRADDEASDAGTEISAYSNASYRSQGSVRSGYSGAGFPAIPEQPGSTEIKDFDWSKLDQYAQYLHEQDALRQKSGIVEMQRKLRMDLDKQVADARMKKQKARQEEHNFYLNQLVEIEQWKQVERVKAEEIKVKAAREKQDRDDQLEYENSIKAEEKKQKDVEEKALVEKIVHEMEAEKEKMETKKVAQRKSMMKVFLENNEERRLKDEAKAQQMQVDAEAMKEYNRILDAQEASRGAELEARMEKQRLLMEKMKEGVVKQQQAKGDEDSNRAERQKEEADARALEMERNKKEKLQNMRNETQAFLFRQMAEKDDKKHQALELKRLQASILEADTKEYMDMESKKFQDKRVKNVDHRLELEKEIEWKNAQKSYAMSESEIKMNRQLLELVDKTLRERDA